MTAHSGVFGRYDPHAFPVLEADSNLRLPDTPPKSASSSRCGSGLGSSKKSPHRPNGTIPPAWPSPAPTTTPRARNSKSSLDDVMELLETSYDQLGIKPERRFWTTDPDSDMAQTQRMTTEGRQ